MPNVRTVVTCLALMATGAISLGSVIRAFSTHPDRASTDRQQLLEALVSTDFRLAPADSKRRFIQRLELDLRSRFDWNSLLGGIEPGERKRVIDNWNDLTQVWFHDKVETYSSRNERRRAAYLDQELDQLRSWRVVREGPESHGGRLRLASVKLGDLARAADASADELQRREQFVTDAQQALDRHDIRRWLPGPK